MKFALLNKSFYRFINSVIILIFIFQLFWTNSFAKERSKNFQRFGTVDGLSQSSVISAFQDSKGFMWFGTYSGINRFNGYEFKVFHNVASDSTSISNNSVRTIYEDHNGQLWMGTMHGLNIFNYETESFIRFEHDPLDSTSLSHNLILSIYEDIKNRLWIGTGDGLNYFNEKNREFISFIPEKFADIDENFRVRSMVEDGSGIFWIGTFKGLYFFDPDKKIFIDKNMENNKNFLISSYITSLRKDCNGNIWIGTLNGLAFYDTKKSEFSHYFDKNDDFKELVSNRIICLFEDDKKNIWIGTDGKGLYQYDISEKRLIHYRNNIYNDNSLSGDHVLSIYEDKASSIWVGVYDGGVNRLDLNFKPFVNYFNKPSDPNSLSSNSVYAIHEDSNGYLWIGTRGGGLNRFEPGNNRFTRFYHEADRLYSLNNDNVLSIQDDKYGRLWVGTSRGLNRFDTDLKYVKYFQSDTDDPHSLGSYFVKKIFEDSRYRLWVGLVNGGVRLYDPAMDGFHVFTYSPDDSLSLSNNYVSDIIEDSEGQIWIGTYSGLNRFNSSDSTFINFKYNMNVPSSLPNDNIHSLAKGDSGDLWIGTESGFIYYSKKNNKFINYSSKYNITKNIIFGILKADDGNLWLSSTQGLTCFNPVTGVVVTYDKSDGLQSNEFNFNSCCRTQNGDLYFGGDDGFTRISPKEIYKNSYIPPVYISNLKISNQPVKIDPSGNGILKKSILETDRLVFPYNKRHITFEFSALNYISTKKNQYKYLMENYDENWTEAGYIRVARYTNLPPGNYNFRVKAANNDGLWNNDGCSVKIKIIAPFWQSIWCKLLIILVIIGLLLLFYKYNISRIDKSRKKLEKRVAERTKELKDINMAKDKFFSIVAHDLKSALQVQLSAARLFSEKIDSLTNNEIQRISKGLKRNTEYLFKMLENLLQWSRLQMERIEFEPTTFNLSEELSNCVNLAKGTAKNKQLKIINKIDEGLKVTADRNMLNFIIRNLISNAIKFSRPGDIITLISQSNTYSVEISIIDSGIGIKQQNLTKIFSIDKHFTQVGTNDEKGTGLGLILCKEFVEKNSGKIFIESEYNKGTTVRFSLPTPARFIN